MGGAIAPKRRIGKTRKRIRRSHAALTIPSLTVCPNCGEKKLYHFVCHCGYYKGKEYIKPKEKTENETKETPKNEKATKKVVAKKSPAKETATKAVKKETTKKVEMPKPAVKKQAVKKAPVKKEGK